MKESSGSSRISPFSSFEVRTERESKAIKIKDDRVALTCTRHAMPKAGPVGPTLEN